MCDQKRTASNDGAVEQDEGFGGFVWGVPEVVEVAVWAEAAEDRGAGWRVEGLAW